MSAAITRFPRFYQGALKQQPQSPGHNGTSEEAKSIDGSQNQTSTGSSSSSRPRRSVAPNIEIDDKDQDAGNGDDDGASCGSPTRPRRQRVRPELFTEYHQVNEEITGKKIKKKKGTSRGAFDTKDPYDGLVFWAKLASHPPWPSVKMTDEEIGILEEIDGLTIKKERAKHGDVPCVAVNFLGSNNKAIVKESDVWDFSSRYDEFTRRKLGKQFSLGLERADEMVLRIQAETKAESDCIVCSTFIDETLNSDSPPVVLCERCLAPAHTQCAKTSGKFANELGGDRPAIWYCEMCTEEAPVTVKVRTEMEERKNRKRKKAAANGNKTPSNGSKKSPKSPWSMSRTGSSNSSSNNSDAGGPSAKRQKQNERQVPNQQHTPTAPPPLSIAAAALKAPPRYVRDVNDISDDFCYVCNDGGTLVICDYPGCRRAYHKFCLNHEAQDDSDDDDDQPWHCPWHFCAECGTCEQPVVVSANGSSSSSKSWAGASGSNDSGNSSSGSGGGGASKILPMYSAPEPRQVRPPNALKDKDDTYPKTSKSEAGNPSTPTLSSTTSGFLHCVSCPLALCAKHKDVTRPVLFVDTAVVPYAIDRTNKKGYFKCEHCNGVQMRSRYQGLIPQVVLNTYLHRVWSRIINGHEHMCKLFLLQISNSDIPKGSASAWKALRQRGVTNMMQVRNKLWTLGYTSEEAFRTDVALVANLTAAVFGATSPIIAETAQSLPLIMDQAFRTLKVTVEDADLSQQAMAAASIKPGDLSNPFQTGCLYPSVVMKRPGADEGMLSTAVAKSTSEWENLLTNTSFKSGQQLEHPEKYPAREEAKGIVASLVAAADSIGGFENHLPPSKASLNDMLEQQSMILRSALRSTACLRDAVQKTFTRFDAGVVDQIEKEDVTLGEMRLAAEYKLVVSSLKAKNAQLRSLLAIERNARQQAEQKLQAIETPKAKS